MIKCFGVGVTDEVNLYNHKVTLRAMYSGYLGAWEEGVPSFFNHDHRKNIGWAKLSGLYLEPHTAYLTNTVAVGETDEEIKRLKSKSDQQIYKKMVIERAEKYEELKHKLGNAITDRAIPCWVNAVSFYDRGIVNRVLPELCTKTSKGLTSVRELRYVQPGIYEKDGWLLFAHKFFRRGFSYLNTLNEPFLKRLQECSNSLDVKVAIDMDCIGLLGTENIEFEYQYWWGPKFNDDLSSIPQGVTVYKNEHCDGLLSDTSRTEFGWYTQDDIQTFECEEIADFENIPGDEIGNYGCRFVHSMISDETHRPYHLDGAIRAYTTEKMVKRLDSDIKHSGRDTQYNKLWRIDGDIEVPLWKELITHYYRDNMQIGEYFGGIDCNLDLSQKKPSNSIETVPALSINSFIPVNMNEGDGLRINVSFDYVDLPAESFDVVVRPTHCFPINNSTQKFYESDTMSVFKFLSVRGFKVRMPFCNRVATEDMVFNFPLFVCKNIEAAYAIVDCFKQLCEIWIRKGDDRLISYSIKVCYQTKSVIFSFVGHIKDFQKWYDHQSVRVPETEDSVEEWLESSYGFLNTFKPAHNSPKISQLMIDDGVLSFPKKMVDKRYIKKIINDGKGIRYQLEVSQEEKEIIKENKIGICAMYIVKHSVCSQCSCSYERCTCQKYISSDVTEKIDNCELLGFVWTNRHSFTSL